MLIAHQKFRSCTLGYYIRLYHIIMCNMRETWGLFYSRAISENIAHVMPHLTARAVMSCAHRAAHTRRQASHPNDIWRARIYLWTCCSRKQQYLSKITASHFSTLNSKIANQNMLKRTLIAMLNENKADSNENFRICSEEPVAPLYKW